MSISDVAYPEGNEGLTPFTFTVLLVGARQGHRDGPLAHGGQHGEGRRGLHRRTKVTSMIPAGDSSGTFTVQVIGDRVKEDFEVFTVQLDKATVQNAYIPDLSNRTGGFAWGRIENDDRVTKPSQTDERFRETVHRRNDGCRDRRRR